MIALKEKQLAAMGNASYENFLARMVRQFTPKLESFEHGVGQDNLDYFVRTCADVAETYEIDTEVDIETFIELSLTLGSNFPKDLEWAQIILDDTSLLGEEKIAKLLEQKQIHDENEAEQN